VIVLRKTARGEHAHSPGQTRCRYCRRLLSALEHYSGDCCSAPSCREQHLHEQLDAFRTDTARAVGETQPERFAIAVVPHRASRLVTIEPERLSVLEERLADLAAVCASARPAAVHQSKEPPEPVPAVCASCQGACCYHGGLHAAFLDEETIGSFAAQHSDLTADAITAAYLRYVPDLHFEGSCVFHTDRGCNLPRTMRAPICNHYECRGLKMARERGGGSHPAFFVVARHDNVIVRGEFVDESGIREPTCQRPV
jgi:hypothetical protein